MSDFELRYATAADAVAAAALLDRHFAHRTPEMVVKLLNAGGAVLLAELEGVLLGVALAAVVPDLAAALPVGQKHLANTMSLASPVGYMKSVAVDEQGRRQGIATALTAERLRWARQQGARSAFSEAWVYPDGRIPASSHLRAAGFTQACVVDSFWTEESIQQHYTCGQCGHPCRCAAALFVWTDDEQAAR